MDQQPDQAADQRPVDPDVLQVARNGALFELPRSAGALLSMGITTPGEVLHLLQNVGS